MLIHEGIKTVRSSNWFSEGHFTVRTCFFIGHHNAPEAVRPLLGATVERHIVKYGIDRFIVGRYGAFDAMAAGSVIRVKQAYPDVELLLLLPYHPAERPVELPQGFDGSYYPEGMERVPRRFAIVRANEYVIRHVCDHLIAYDRHLATKTHNFVELALQREKKGLMHVTNLAELKNT